MGIDSGTPFQYCRFMARNCNCKIRCEDMPQVEEPGNRIICPACFKVYLDSNMTCPGCGTEVQVLFAGDRKIYDRDDWTEHGEPKKTITVIDDVVTEPHSKEVLEAALRRFHDPAKDKTDT